MFKKVNKIKKMLRNNKGFTILELVVVIAIMGFLVSMIAPRFAGVVGGAVDPVCDTNQQRLVGILGTYTEQNNSLPNKVTTLIPDAGVNAGATVDEYVDGLSTNDWYWNGDKAIEDATFSEEFIARNHMHVHTLNADEAKELKQLGISQVISLENGAEANVAAGVNVLMIGAGAPDATNPISLANTDMAAGAEYGESDQMYRILLGFGDRSDLVTEGLVSAAGLCPGGVQNEDNVAYNNYNIVLPRLQATVDRLDTTVGSEAPTSLTLVSDTGETRAEDLTEVQEAWQFATQCPEGHKWPASDAEIWTVQ